MKIGIVLSSTPSKSETFFVSKIKFLQKLGHEVILFSHRNNDFSQCKVIQHPRKKQNVLLQILDIFYSLFNIFLKYPKISNRFLNYEKKDGIKFYYRMKNLYLNQFILMEKLDWLHFGYVTLAIHRENIAKAINSKMGISIRGYDICIYPLKNIGCYDKVWRKVDKVHSISNDLLEKAYSYGLKKDTMVQIINPAIDTSLFKFNKRTSNYNFSNKKIKFLTVARLHWKKGIEYTLEALSILHKKSIIFEYTIIGDGLEYERLKFCTHQLGLDNYVRFLRHIEHKKVKKFYNEADIYLQYSISEGFCNAVLESQSQGLLTIVSDAEGLRENVLDNKTGWVVPKRKPKELANKIKEVLEIDKKKLDRINQNALKRINNNFTQIKQIREFQKFYK